MRYIAIYWMARPISASSRYLLSPLARTRCRGLTAAMVRNQRQSSWPCGMRFLAMGWWPSEGLARTSTARALGANPEGSTTVASPPGGFSASTAEDVSFDGSVVVGNHLVDGSAALAFVWQSGVLNLLDGGALGSGPMGAYRVSGSGEIVIGEIQTGSLLDNDAGFELFVWTPSTGMRLLREVLQVQADLRMAGWRLGRAADVELSPDGAVVAGWGTGPSGVSEGWIAKWSDGGDRDGDGDLDALDNCPDAFNADQSDGDGDGAGDVCDAFPADAGEQWDTDGDGTGDNADTDDDGDGTLDVEDAFPLDAGEDTDTDRDGTGDNADTDDDGDGWSDAEEGACGTDALEAASVPTDTDGDQSCDALDADDDGDGTADDLDAFPLDASEDLDTDGDGIGDESWIPTMMATVWSDSDELACGTESLNSESVPTDTVGDP